VAEMTVGDMWEDYLIWKEPQVQQVASRINFLDFSAHFFLVLIFFWFACGAFAPSLHALLIHFIG
jgi:hypothetical protein